MGWLYLTGIVLLALVFFVVQGLGSGDPPGTDPDDPDAPRDYQWGDELYEYSYRHPWDDEL